MSEQIKVYPPKVVHDMESIYNAKKFLSIAKKVEADENPVFKLEQPWGEQFIVVDKQVKQIWEGWLVGKAIELKSEGFGEVVGDVLKAK